MFHRLVLRAALGGCAAFAAASASAQAGYPPPQPQPQPVYQPAPYQPAPQQPQPALQQPQPAPQQPQPAPPPPYGQPVPAQPPAYGQPAPAQPAQPVPPAAPYGQPAPSQPQPGYPPAPAPYPGAAYPAPMAPEVQGPIPDGAFQLGLSTSIVRYQPLNIEYENNGGEFDLSNLTWGVAENPIAFELGYGLSDQLVLGGQLALGGSSQSIEQMGGADNDSSEFHFEFGPKLDFMFSPGATVNPFIGGLVLVNLDSYDNGGGVKGSSTSFQFLARIGMRAFLAEAFSIDPALMVGGGFGSGSDENNNTSFDYDLSGFVIGLNLGISGWLR